MKIWQFILIVGMGVFSMAMATPALADSSFQQVYSNTPADYYRRVSPRGGLSRNIYKSGGRQTSAANMTPIARATKYAGREAHVIREEVTVDGTWLKFTVGHHVVGWMLNAGMSQSYLRLNVPVIAQRPQLPTGCEITATAMMLRYSGAAVTKTALAREMPRSKNPNKGFVGNPYSKSGWWIYPGGLMKLVKRHAGSAINMTGATFGRLKLRLTRITQWLCG